MKKILIIDTKAGNLFSLQAAIKRLGFESKILATPTEETFDGIVIPGQGRFGTVMSNIRDEGWDRYLTQARQQMLPMLGICVGMQIFFEASDEDPEVAGLGWFSSKAEALNFPKKPMVGWARLDSNCWPDSEVYFVNSYAIKQSEYSIAQICYGETFCAAVKKDCFTGVQFHPEKSSATGAAIIAEALNANNNGGIEYAE
jgi:imidazole glycerol-phosphate synthase subunit HisH